MNTEQTSENIFTYKDMFNFSEYPENSKFYDEIHKKVIGKIKDETESLRCIHHKKDNEGEKNAKNIRRHIVKKITKIIQTYFLKRHE